MMGRDMQVPRSPEGGQQVDAAFELRPGRGAANGHAQI